MNASKKTKTTNENRVMIGLDKDLHHRLKVRAVDDGRTIRSIVEELVEAFLQHRPAEYLSITRLKCKNRINPQR